ncbi:hypothetical protein MAPG_00368 [Magnaporthiopsis poae ATCC 64411]|uniref:Uncharacterized protein n=1 Tax=Magnaporthiopsis poae (strain ATCC 64411 / 73-15) TaxID=644358 RepID=A0A0C4DKT8_MAGP6|nr:hypothetical protein MAPG_00368 [Magnaporthiopsis poae ATCC 64411]
MGVPPNLHISLRSDGGRCGLDAAHTLASLRRASSPHIATPFDSLVIPDIQDPQHQHRQSSAGLPRIHNLFAISDAGRTGQYQADWERRGSYPCDVPPTPRSATSLALSSLPSPPLTSSSSGFFPSPPPQPQSQQPGTGSRPQLPSPPATPLTDTFAPSPADSATTPPSSSYLSSFKFAFPVTTADYPAVAGPCSSRPSLKAVPAAAKKGLRRRATEEPDEEPTVCPLTLSPRTRTKEEEPWRAKKITELSATWRRLRRRHSDSDTATSTTSSSSSTSPSPSPSSSTTATLTSRRKTGKKRGPGSNAKYPLAHGDFIVYMKVEKNLKWETVTAEFNRALDRLAPYLSPSEHATRLPDHRRQDGAQAIFYRINEVIPVLDGRGGVRFAPDGREMDEWIKCRDEKDHGVRLPGLIDRYPERVAAMNYWFVDEQDMQRARRLAAIRERQRRELGLPTWAQQQQMKVPPERLDCQRRRVKKSQETTTIVQQRSPTATPSPARDLFSTL